MRLMVRLPNWVGDACMALPTLHALSQVGFELHLVGRGWAPGLLGAGPWQVHTLPRDKRAAVTALRGLDCRHGLLLTNSLSSALIARRAGIRCIGYRGEGRGLLLAKGLRKRNGRHEVHAFWELGAAATQRWAADRISAWPAKPAPRLDLPLSDHAREHAGQILAE
ncbi:MAG: glycosyltransferase family 9 protein, partial [Planctomycetota bacterium]